MIRIQRVASRTIWQKAVFDAGADALWVHARKAWLKGLSPKENRDIPPLDYDRVYRLEAAICESIHWDKWRYSDTSAKAFEHLNHVDGVMLGRAVYHNPMMLAEVDTADLRQ